MGSFLQSATEAIPPPEPLTQAKHRLVVDLIRQFGEVRLKATGTSMVPAVWPGDILTVRRRDAGELQPGQIILCYRDQGFVAHRLIGQNGNSLVTRGDCLPYQDPPFSEDEVLGQVVGVLRNGRSVDPSRNWWSSAASWILRRSDLCTRLALRLRRPGPLGPWFTRILRSGEGSAGIPADAITASARMPAALASERSSDAGLRRPA